MASNKFATMVHRKTNKITLILIYAMLEWVLIVLLLGNSLFSYLIIKFADYFGLKKPCIWCSRLDHILEPAKCNDSYRSLLCESHAEEISRLGYCANHRKLAESQDMCEDCSSSSHFELPENFAFFPWMKRLEILQVSGGGVKVIENGRMDSKCSCCGVVLDARLYSHDYHLGKPSWEESLTTQKNFLILDSPGDEKVDEYDHSERNTSCFVSDHGEDEQGIDENRGVHLGNREEETGNNCLFSISTSISKYMAVAAADDDKEVDVAKEKELEQFKEDECKEFAEDESRNLPVMVQIGGSKDVSSEIQPMHLEFYIDEEDCHLIPVELTEVTTAEKLIPRGYVKGEEEICGKEDFVLEFDMDESIHYELISEETRNLEEEAPLLSGHDTEKQPQGIVFDFMEVNENESFWGELDHYDLGKGELEQVATAQETQSPTGHDVQEIPSAVGAEMESDNNQVSEEVLQVQSKEVELVSEDVHQVRVEEVEAVSEEGLQLEGNEVETEVPIGPEIPDQELFDDIQAEDIASSCRCRREDPSNSTAIDNAFEYVGCSEIEDVVEFKTISVEISEPVTEYRLSFCSESNEIEEDKVPDTPTSIDSLHYIHKRLSLLERGESGAEESLDGSIVGNIEAGGVMTVEKLKLALTAERKALHSLYMELEEERSASAVAANQTMAMINRLQEEKAAMRMEALQYQRMMEEQVEYDQEALQLLNELMVKREKELELCRKKIQDYEAKEKIMILRRKDDSTRSGTCSATCSAAEDSDELSIDMDHDGKEDSFYNHQESNTENTPADAVLYLAESLSNFEEERLSILVQLKLLEEKLFTLSDEEDQHFEDIKPVEQLYEDSGYQVTPLSSIQANGVANGHHKESNGKHHLETKNIGAKAKRLLPLFDATDVALEDGVVNGHEETNDSIVLTGPVDRFIDDRKLAIEEEVDHVYERLQALEADREFIRNCLTSLRKGDKGIELLQEILHHLRDLRRVELRVRSMGDSVQ